MNGSPLARHWPWLLVSVALGVFVWLLSTVLTPFAVAVFLAWVGEPLVHRLERHRWPRTAAVTLVFLVILLVLVALGLLLAPLVEDQIRRLVAFLPVAVERLRGLAEGWFGGHAESIAAWLDPERLRALAAGHWREAGGAAAGLLGVVMRSGAAAAVFLGNLVLVPVVTFYLLRDWDAILARLNDLIPPRHRATAGRLARESDEVLATFFKGQFLVMAALAAIYSLGLWMAGLELALLIGLIAGLVSFVPWLGPVIGVIAAGAAMYFQTGDLAPLVPVAIVFGVGQLLEGMVLTPLLVGERIGLHPVAVIFAVLAGGALFGFLGVLLALPVAAVLAVLARHLAARWRASPLYTGMDEG